MIEGRSLKKGSLNSLPSPGDHPDLVSQFLNRKLYVDFRTAFVELLDAGTSEYKQARKKKHKYQKEVREEKVPGTCIY